MSIITVLTDFGIKDPYVGIMKGVMLSINPDLSIVDITHGIEPQDVREASFLIPEYYPYFAPGTVHLCVVDPTVGSSRKAVVVAKDGHLFVGPDNGLFSLIVDGASIRKITNNALTLRQLSSTFQGRDLFSPVAAYLSTGIDTAIVGPLLDRTVQLDRLKPVVRNDTLTGEIVKFDRFGNGITNIHYEEFRAFTGRLYYAVEIGDLSFHHLSRSYFESELTVVIGSSGYLEFALYKGSFKEEKGLARGAQVVVRRDKNK
jgi:S-adenosyl-L-methionine hydrolase (adenosine-forming)